MSDEDLKDDKPAGSKRKRLLLIAALVAFVVVAATGAYLFWMSSEDQPEQLAEAEVGADATEQEPSEDLADGEASQELVITPFREIIVNISATTASGNQTQRFLKLNLALAYDESAEGAERLMERQPYIRDAFIDYLRLLSENELRGSAGLARLRADLLHRARSLAETAAPQEILVVDLVIQ